MPKLNVGQTNANIITAFRAALAAPRVDIEQEFTSEEKTQVLTNIGAGSANDIAALQNSITNIQAAVGSPLVAATVAAMTDHSKIYVYVGSEAGYINGNWYYWSGSAWISGGTYNSTALDTDKTLSIVDKAADAGAVGGQLKYIENAINLTPNLETAAGIEQGGLTGQGINTTPADSNFTKRLRSSGYFPLTSGEKYILKLTSTQNILWSISYYNTNDFTTPRIANENWMPIGATITVPSGATYGRLLFMISGGAAVVPSDITYLTFAHVGESIVKKIPFIESGVKYEVQNALNWTIGTVAATLNGQITTDAGFSNRLTHGKFLLLCDIDIINSAGAISPNMFDANGNLLGNLGAWFSSLVTREQMLAAYPTAKYMRIVFKHNDGTNCALTDVETYGIKAYYTDQTLKIDKTLSAFNMLYDRSFEQGSIISSGINSITQDPKIVRISDYIPVRPSTEYLLFADTPVAGLTANVFYYTANDFRTNCINYVSSNNIPFAFKTPATAAYIRVVFTSTTNFAPSDIDGVALFPIVTDDVVATSFVYGADFIKRPVETNFLGQLTYSQSFCKYNGKYYSTNGTNISVQDSSFVEETNVATSLGHGNSFQIGNGNIAYVSGWDDQTVYGVNLSTLTIDETITLPTTGYTTAAIDDVNKIAYIFQRDSFPSTEANYNFIVYDYDNEQIVSTHKINSFAAMQACDFYNGKIAILWGLGTSSAPSGMAIYNTSGDMLAQFDLNIFASVEPEGIMFDRNTKNLLVSDVQKRLFKVKAI